MEKKEKVEGKLESSKSAVVLKTIYVVLILVIFVNCIVLIYSILSKPDTTPIVSKMRIINADDINSEKKQEEKTKEEDKAPSNEER